MRTLLIRTIAIVNVATVLWTQTAFCATGGKIESSSARMQTELRGQLQTMIGKLNGAVGGGRIETGTGQPLSTKVEDLEKIQEIRFIPGPGTDESNRHLAYVMNMKGQSAVIVKAVDTVTGEVVSFGTINGQATNDSSASIKDQAADRAIQMRQTVNRVRNEALSKSLAQAQSHKTPSRAPASNAGEFVIGIVVGIAAFLIGSTALIALTFNGSDLNVGDKLLATVAVAISVIAFLCAVPMVSGNIPSPSGPQQ